MIKVLKQSQSLPTVIPPTYHVWFYDTTDPSEKIQMRMFPNWAQAQDWIFYQTDFETWKEDAECS